MKAIEVDVFGLVQGVGFRWFAQRTAQEHNIVGWVSNQTDGSVKVQAQGSQSDLTDFCQCLRRGLAFIVVLTKLSQHIFHCLRQMTLLFVDDSCYNSIL